MSFIFLSPTLHLENVLALRIKFRTTEPSKLFLWLLFNLQKSPDSFLKYLDRKIPQNQAVLQRGDEEWRVKISDQFLREGWRAFAVENELHVGDFVVFEHEENMVFEVLVFDPSHCERKYASIDDEKKCSQKFKAAG